MDTKSIFASKTLWLNLLGIAVTVVGVLPPVYAAPTLAILNILNRFLTTQPVTVLPS